MPRTVEDSTVQFLGEILPIELLELPEHLVRPVLKRIIHLFEDVRAHDLDKNVVRERLYEMLRVVEANLHREAQFPKSWSVVRTRLLHAFFNFARPISGPFSPEHQAG
jgi:hypothetical protein